jgi:hypothetical protein
LGERLHEMVCGGELELSTAPRDVATIGLQPIRSISILTDLSSCIRVSTPPPISWS